jgi:hypothetical protein
MNGKLPKYRLEVTLSETKDELEGYRRRPSNSNYI